MTDTMYAAEARVAYKGQVFSTSMDWNETQRQLEAFESDAALVAELPLTGEMLEARVAVSISSGLVDLNKCIKEATIRRNVVVQLIRMHRDSGHPQYRSLNMADVERRAKLLTPKDVTGDVQTIPDCVINLLNGEDPANDASEVDKAATPAERTWNEADLTKCMDRARPQLLLPQRDSDAQKEVTASRLAAFGKLAQLDLHTGSNLISQFQTSNVPEVFNLTFPWCVGGPDFKGQPRYRRQASDAPFLSLDAFTAMTARRVEAQFRWDWDLNPALQSLSFASKVNLGMSMSVKRALKGSHEGDVSGEDISAAAKKILSLLWFGEYTTHAGNRMPVRGDLSKILQIHGLTDTEKPLINNYHFMSSRLSGSRQIRRSMNHIMFSSRVVYGLPVFMTVTPSERHSGLTIRLTRYRRKDPALSPPDGEAVHPFQPWCGFDVPTRRESVDGPRLIL